MLKKYELLEKIEELMMQLGHEQIELLDGLDATGNLAPAPPAKRKRI